MGFKAVYKCDKCGKEEMTVKRNMDSEYLLPDNWNKVIFTDTDHYQGLTLEISLCEKCSDKFSKFMDCFMYNK